MSHKNHLVVNKKGKAGQVGRERKREGVESCREGVMVGVDAFG